MPGRADRPRPRPPPHSTVARIAAMTALNRQRDNAVYGGWSIPATSRRRQYIDVDTKNATAMIGLTIARGGVQNDLQVWTKIANDAGIRIDE